MDFAEIKDGVCINVIVFENEMKAKEFDNTLIKLEDGFGKGDWYKNNVWSKAIPTIEQQIEKIDKELKQIDNEGVNRHLENQIEATNTYDTIYESTRKLIDRKNELREQRKLLVGGASSGEDNTNE